MPKVKVLDTSETACLKNYILRQDTNVLSQKVISATHYKASGKIIIRNGQHSIETDAGDDPIAAIEAALQGE